MRVPKPQHKRRVPKLVERGRFSQTDIRLIAERDEGLCILCHRQGHHIHHVMPKSRQGRGVFTNGALLCHECHTEVHKNNDLLYDLIDRFADWYGEDFYKDKHDVKKPTD